MRAYQREWRRVGVDRWGKLTLEHYRADRQAGIIASGQTLFYCP